MDQRFNMGDQFEKMLKEKCDDFRMYPSKRVWYSIYNNMHPGRRWPSVTMSITLISILLVTGFLNTNKTKQSITADQIQVAAIIKPQQKTLHATDKDDKNNESITTAIQQQNDNNTSSVAIKKGTIQQQSNSVIINDQPKTSFLINAYINNNSSSSAITQKRAGILSNAKTTIVNKSRLPVSSNVTINEVSPNTTLNTNANVPLSAEEKAWVENYTLQNSTISKKWTDKLGFQLYASPSMVYSKLSANMPFENTNQQSLISSNEENNPNVEHTPALGLEAGATMQYPLTDIIKVKAGLQFNYTSYHIKAAETNHPVSSALRLNDFNAQTSYLNYATSSLSNGIGGVPVTLSNRTYQLSMPVGVEFKVAGNEALQLNIGATIQPTFILGDNAYLMSADKRNFINSPSLLNQWNLNAGFETFISYKVNGLIWQVGPQYRRQLSSSYDKKYTINENLNNYGLKIGVTRTIQ